MLNHLIDQLWQQYINETPQVATIHQLFTERGERVTNDHIAIRTFADRRVNIEKLAQVFIKLGYQEKGQYTFKTKKLSAKHYEHQHDTQQPKIFISELQLDAFSHQLQQVAIQCINNIPTGLLDTAELLYSGIHWQPLDYNIYQQLLAESEYAAWLYAFGFRANHFTMNINQLQNFDSLAEVNRFLEDHQIELNQSGGKIKGTPEQLLEQSSTLAAKVDKHFKQGSYSIPNSYYEFAKRYPDQSGTLYQGFIAQSADKIFESTDNKNKS